jgi:hypothetical protein
MKTLTLTIDADGGIEVSMTGYKERNCLAVQTLILKVLGARNEIRPGREASLQIDELKGSSTA